MKTILLVVQAVLALLLILSILAQQKGSGLSATFGGSGGGFQASKRGAEKVLEYITIIVTVLFIINSLAFFFI